MSYKSKDEIETAIGVLKDNHYPPRSIIIEYFEELQRLRELMVAAWPYIHLPRGSMKAPRAFRECVKSINKIVLDERDMLKED